MPELKGTVKVVKDHITLDREMKEAIQDFIGSVWLMRKAQKEAAHPQLTKEYEMSVDSFLSVLVKQDVSAPDQVIEHELKTAPGTELHKVLQKAFKS